MAHHHSERQPLEGLPPLPSTDPTSTGTGTGSSTANQPIPPSFDPSLVNPPPPSTIGDSDSAKASKSSPSSDPANSPTNDPLSPPTDPNNPGNSGSSTSKPPDQSLGAPAPTSSSLPSSDHSKHPNDPTSPHDGASTTPSDSPLPGSPTSSSPASVPSQPPQSPSEQSQNPSQTSSASLTTASAAPVPASNTSSKRPNPTSPIQSDLPSGQPIAGTVNPSTIDQATGAKSPDSSASRAARPQQQNSHSDDSTGTHVGTIMGILVAAVIGALILAGILGMIKRKRRERQNQAAFHQDIFQEKNSFEPEMDRKSFGSARNPMNTEGSRSFNPRGDGIFGPRPPSIIERHQASPAIPAPMPSYQPGQVLNYPHYPGQPQQQSFNLHRPKPPTYHSGYPEESGLAYAANPPVEPSPNPRSNNTHDQKHVTLEMSHQDSPQSNRYEYHGGNQHIPMQNMMGHGTAGGLSPSTYPVTGGVVNHPGPVPNYQQQVDQLDFFGQPSPALTMVGHMTTDWNQGGSPHEKPLAPPPLSPISMMTPPGPLPSEEDRSGTPMNPNLQQSYLDCDSKVSEHLPISDSLPHPSSDDHGFQSAPISGNEDWKLASPHLSSPLGEMFKDDAYLGASIDQHHLSDTDHNKPSAHSSLKVINP
ncbi:hypothetical protein PGTUg99_004367 [Puccinia graminis f. sp. tritici]|uniref:Uncharacterized protein n=1 Tax=Puccinia graminis f. sp. tritici TaxID=56615 RepID=A0A5B0NDL7_PUCGR|nr:hypothetical protein PGTUg99_004367 [Puccinia graminis f. sp. tritici]